MQIELKKRHPLNFLARTESFLCCFSLSLSPPFFPRDGIKRGGITVVWLPADRFVFFFLLFPPPWPSSSSSSSSTPSPNAIFQLVFVAFPSPFYETVARLLRERYTTHQGGRRRAITVASLESTARPQ